MTEVEPCTPASSREELAVAWGSVDAYFVNALQLEDEVLVCARESSNATTMPSVEVTANAGALLALLAQLIGAKRVLEFGTLAGYSALWLGRAVGEDGIVVTLELEEQNAVVARENLRRAGLVDRVEVIVGPALDSAEKLIADGVAPFDLVFIDADKPNNPHYLRQALALTRPGAVIVVDNVVRDGRVLDADSPDPRVQGSRAVLQDIAGNPQLEATALQTVGSKGWDGMIIARRR
ncbi:O-methyltransferase [Buchananella hordeovulneris]|uniref:O-methyltransferase n=1 Tax=Buchananella hordeovulneris TaxID=52770 RepID=UPI000F5FD480|nr:O-methyltransferase [Buchananella hordeovulneris]RRD43597.1 O-methyltransferase [Buchananella hordeovulneris]